MKTEQIEIILSALTRLELETDEDYDLLFLELIRDMVVKFNDRS